VSIAPDTKDWTWVLDRPCGECGFDAASFRRDEVGRAIRANAAAWVPLLQRPDVGMRPHASKWSVLEYACHVRDVLGIFDARLLVMLRDVDPVFENWDQDKTAVADRYERQDPGVVASQILSASSVLAAHYEGVTDAQWHRPGTRSDGSRFTVETLAIYGLHDPIHHLWDVTPVASPT
jgi:hypothetical protein